MRRAVVTLVAGAALLVGPVAAQAPSGSPLPVPREAQTDAPPPEASTPDTAAQVEAEPAADPETEAEPAAPAAPDPATPDPASPDPDTPRPASRPDPDTEAEPEAEAQTAAVAGPRSLIPAPRPSGAWPPPGPQTGEPISPDELAGPVGTHEVTVRGGLFGGGTRVLEVPAFAGDGATAVLLSPRPDLRPDGLEGRVRAEATRTTPSRVTQPGSRGQLCGRPGLVGDRLEPIIGRISGCGIAEPVRVREVDGIALSSPATINCTAATALQDWLSEAQDIVGRTGGGIASLRVVASYSCRTRNNQPGARLSEHSVGNGIDIAGIGLVNGQELTVLGGWRDASQGPILRALHGAACGPFGTVLGPDSDRFHQDHFHFDTAAYRAGAYCR